MIATTNGLSETTFWPLGVPRAMTVEGYDTYARRPVAFTPDGRYLMTNWGQDRVRLWPLPGSDQLEAVDLVLPSSFVVRQRLAVDAAAEKVLSVGYGDAIYLLSVNGGEPRRFQGFPSNEMLENGAFSPSGRLVAAASTVAEGLPTVRVWDLETDVVRTYEQPPADTGLEGYSTFSLAFKDEATLYTAGANGLLRWDLETGKSELIQPAPQGGALFIWMAGDRQEIFVAEARPVTSSRVSLQVRDLSSGTSRQLEWNPPSATALDFDDGGEILVAGDSDGIIRVARVEGSEAYILAGHTGAVSSVAISPDKRWIASAGQDETLRLWPMPDLSKPPLHTLPHDELIAKLKSLTNLRAVRDPESSTGWKIEVGPFPGWAEVPTW